MNKLLRCLLIAVATVYAHSAFSQCVPLPAINFVNPSFEGTPQPHVTPGPWSVCMAGQTPDTQPGSWGVTLPPTDGSSYLGLVHQPSTGWQEGACEQLSSPFVAGTNYTFTIDLANVQNAQSGVGILPGCAELQMWGGYGPCDDNTGTGVLLWSSGDIQPYDTWQTYSVSVTPTQNFTWVMWRINSLGCSDGPYVLVDNISPIVPANVSIVTTTVDQSIACPGMTNGQATVHAAGEFLPFTYLWNSTPAQTDSVLDNVAAGTYSVTVTDANTCTATATINITEPQPITLTPTTTNVVCFGFNTGSAYMSYAGGTAPFTFHWSNNVNAQPNGNLFAGTYGITATDANGCTATASITITQPTQLTITGVITNPTCNTPGSVTTTTNGGTAGYTYAWNTSPVQTTANAVNLPGGVYIVTCTDASSCTASASFNLPPVPNAPSVTLTPANASCFGQNNGSIASNPSGGNPGYTFSWSTTPVQTTPTATNLPAGNYSVTITDANTCTASASATVGQPIAVLVNTSKTDVLCFGQSTGAATANASGGTPNYTYNWNSIPAQTTPTATNLSAGNYTVTVTDATGCTASSSISVNQPAAALSVTQTHTNVTCFGGSNGTATATATGGTGTYSYSWNTTPTQTTSSIATLVAGTYTVSVTDANACIATVSAVITQPATGVSVTTTTTTPLCFGQPNGAMATPAGGTGPYAYAWNTTPVQNTQSISNVSGGTYTVTATDANGCTATATANVAAAPAQLMVTTSVVNVLCFGQSTGSATATGTGGTGAYSYAWNTNPIQFTATATNLPAGTYVVGIRDANNCTASGSATINQPVSALSLSETHVDEVCFGGNTGSATVTATGGTPGYTYSWNTTPAQNTATASSLAAGVYTATVNDANNCSATISSVVSQPTALSVTTSISSPTCFGQPLASATSNASGGTSGYTYSWNTVPPQSTQNVSNIPAGTYTVTATDANTCTATASIIVPPAPTQLVVTVSHTDVLCFGTSTGSVTANASGSYGGYTYNWNSNPVQTTATASQLAAGTYNVTVTDVQGCSATASDVVSQPASAVSVTTSKTDVVCFGAATGDATATASGGTPGYNYSWNTSPAQNTAFISALLAGTYIVTVTDANACSQTASETINQPTQLNATFTSVDVDCNGANNGSIAITATGGNPAYSYQWSTVLAGNSPNASGLPAGNYSATITDANSCATSLTNMVISEPAALVLDTTVVAESCPNHNDGSIVLTTNGGTLPYVVSWSGGITNTSQLPGGSYSVTVSDNHHCTMAMTNIVVNTLPGVSMSGVATNIPCAEIHNGTVDVTASSTFLPLQYQWSTGETSEDLSLLNEGTYSITITDTKGCTAASTFVVRNDNVFTMDVTPDVATINLGETVNLQATAVTGMFGSAIWTPSNGLNCTDCFNPVSSAVESISYYVTGTDINGCHAYDSVRVNVVPIYTIYIPNAFTPNGDGNNDFFEVMGDKNAWKQFEVQLFSRWGEKVYESNDMNFQWDGVYKGKLMEPTVLVYLVKLVYLDNYTEKIHKGTVTLIR